MLVRVRLSVDVEPELRRRVRIAAASRDLSVKEWVEEALLRALASEGLDALATPGGSTSSVEGRTDEDGAWLESDLSRLGEFEPYEWAEGELEEGALVRYEPGVGPVIEGGKKRAT